MKTIIYGQIVKKRYYVDWDWDYNNYQDVLDNTDNYIKETSETIGYEEIKEDDKVIDLDTYRIHKSEYNMFEKTVIHYTDKVIETIEADPKEREEKIKYAKLTARDCLKHKKEMEQSIDKKKWYQFWK